MNYIPIYLRQLLLKFADHSKLTSIPYQQSKSNTANKPEGVWGCRIGFFPFKTQSLASKNLQYNTNKQHMKDGNKNKIKIRIILYI